MIHAHCPTTPLLSTAVEEESRVRKLADLNSTAKMVAFQQSGGLVAQLAQLYEIPSSDVKHHSIFQALRRPDVDTDELLASIPSTPQPSYRPLHLLYILLSELPGPWAPFSLIKVQTRLTKLLPGDATTAQIGEFSVVRDAVSSFVKQSYTSFSDFLRHDNIPALRTPQADNFITHRGLARYVEGFQLPVRSSKRRPVVAIALPNGPLLAATCIAVTTYYTAAPINPAAGAEQFQADVIQSGAKCILTTHEDVERLELGLPWVADAGIKVLTVDWQRGDTITIHDSSGKAIKRRQGGDADVNKADDIALILFTSGTSGTKKVVPITLHSIVAGVLFVIESWGLGSTDICLNMMPLYHVYVHSLIV